jgi:hypothetical protein
MYSDDCPTKEVNFYLILLHLLLELLALHPRELAIGSTAFYPYQPYLAENYTSQPHFFKYY